MKNYSFILIVLLLTFLTLAFGSCRKEVDGFELFTVRAGEHYCNGNRFHPYTKESLDFEFKVDESWIWKNKDPSNVNGWSKISGFSESFDHSKNRVVLVVRYESEKIIIGVYGNTDGVPFEDKLFEAKVGGIYFCRISIEEGFYVVRISGLEWKIKMGTTHRIGVRLNPHLGGEYVLDHNWDVLLNFK